jgi:hypothetical protein
MVFAASSCSTRSRRRRAGCGKAATSPAAEVGVDHDPVAHLETGLSGEARLGHDADADHDPVRPEVFPGAEPDGPAVAVACDALDPVASADVHAPVPEVVGHEAGEPRGEEPGAQVLLREDHGDVPPDEGQRRGELAADEPAAHDNEPASHFGQGAQPAVVFHGAEVDDALGGPGEYPRASARGEEEAPVGVGLAAVVPNRVLFAVQRHHPPAQVEVGLLGRRRPPDLLLGSARPESLAQGRAVVGGLLLSPHQSDRSVRVDLADAANGRVGGHAAADDQVVVRAHRLPPGSGRRWASQPSNLLGARGGRDRCRREPSPRMRGVTPYAGVGAITTGGRAFSPRSMSA